MSAPLVAAPPGPPARCLAPQPRGGGRLPAREGCPLPSGALLWARGSRGEHRGPRLALALASPLGARKAWGSGVTHFPLEVALPSLCPTPPAPSRPDLADLTPELTAAALGPRGPSSHAAWAVWIARDGGGSCGGPAPAPAPVSARSALGIRALIAAASQRVRLRAARGVGEGQEPCLGVL